MFSNPLWLLPTICNNVPFFIDLKSHVYLFIIAFQPMAKGISYFKVYHKKLETYRSENLIYEHKKTPHTSLDQGNLVAHQS